MVFLMIGLGFAALAISVFFAYKNRHSTSKWMACVTLGILFATFFMVLPTEWVKEGKTVEDPELYSALSALLYSFKATTGRQDLAQLESIALNGALKTAYIYVNYLFFAVAPVLASGLVISFIGDTSERIRYFFSRQRRCCVFSEINERSLALAKRIRTLSGKTTLVFCNTKDTDKKLLTKAKKMGGITLYRACETLKLHSRRTRYEIYLISENEDRNTLQAQHFITNKDKLSPYDITVTAFAKGGTDVEVLESMLAKKPCAVFESTEDALLEKAAELLHTAPGTRQVFFRAKNDPRTQTYLAEYNAHSETDPAETYEASFDEAEPGERFGAYDLTLYYVDTDGGVAQCGLGYHKGKLVREWQDQPLKLRFVDEAGLFCHKLIFEHPLYDLPKGRKDISVLLIGCGRMGTHMLKTALWCGNLPEHTMKIRVLDKKADEIRRELFSQCPELSHYDILFDEVDVETDGFEEKVKLSSDATFVFIATGDDKLNLATAENVYRILRRNYTGFTPRIFTRVRGGEKNESLHRKGSYLADRGIALYGSTASLFSNEILFDAKHECLALAVHLCYCSALDEPKGSFAYQKALNDFYTSEYTRRSSMAAALHIPAKLSYCGIRSTGLFPEEEELARFEDAIASESVKQALMESEHERWNAFMRSEGYRGADFDTVKQYARITRSHKDEKARLHPCITSWDELDLLQEKYDCLQEELHLKESNFKKYDKKLVTQIPAICRKAKELYKEGK